jgi:hypothetical protein
MTGPDQRLSDEAARRRRELRWEQAQHAATRAVLGETNQMLLGVYLRERLADPRDFDVYIGMDAVVDERGRIVWTRVDLLISELLAARPHLAATREELPWQRGVSAVDWFSTGT